MGNHPRKSHFHYFSSNDSQLTILHSWTDDEYLQKWRFCSPFRVCDRESQFFVQNVVEKGSQQPNDVVFRVLLYQTFTRSETYNLLEKKLKPLTWASYKRSAYAKVLGDAYNRGQSLYTGAYQKPAPCFNSEKAYENHLMLIEMFMERGIVQELLDAKYLADIYEFIGSFPGMGMHIAFDI